MAKKNKKKDQLPEGMSRRQAKLAARAAERAALEKDPRPYGALSFETELVAMQEFVPSAVAQVTLVGRDAPVFLCTVLPGGVAALVREESEGAQAFVALQTAAHSHNPGRDLAFALQWVTTAKPGQSLASGVADGTQPVLEEILDPKQDFEVIAHQDFHWWLPEGAQNDPAYQQSLQAANDAIMPSYRVEAKVEGSHWWVCPSDKAHIRWVRGDAEATLLPALARIAARGELKLGEGTKFAGVFRTHGLVVPVWDLPADRGYDTYAADLEDLAAKIDKELGNEEPLTADERKQLDNIKSRQVTLR